MRLGRCSTSGQVVRIASSTPASATSSQLAPPERRRGRPARCAPSARPQTRCGGAAGDRARAGAGVGRSGGVLGGLGRPVLMVSGCRGPRGSAQHTEASCDIAAHRRRRRPALAARFASDCRDEGSGGRRRRRGRGVRGDRPAPARCSSRSCSPTSRSSGAGRGGRAPRRARPLPRRARRRLRAARTLRRADRAACARRGAERVRPALQRADLRGRFEARVTYLDMAMTLSHRHPERPYELPGEMLGDCQLAQRRASGSRRALLALVGIGVEPGPVGRVRPPRRRRAVLEHRRSGRARRRRPASSRATTSRPRSRSGRRSRSA